MTDTSTTTGSSAPAAPTPPAPPPPAGPTPEHILRELRLAAVKAELLKPVAAATEDLFSNEPAKAKAREAIKAAYAKVAGKSPDGKLRADHKAADAQFRITAEDMAGRLDAWIAKFLAPGQPLYALLKARNDAAAALGSRAGLLEGKRDEAAATTRKWAAAFRDWSAPEKRIEIQSPAEIQSLNGKINNQIDEDYSVYRFWFEIAPKHLGAAETSVASGQLKSLDTMRTELNKHFPELAAELSSGSERLDGPVYLLDPEALHAKRTAIREQWAKAAAEQAAPEVDYQLAPDDTASLKNRRDQLDKQYDEAVRAAMPDKPTA